MKAGLLAAAAYVFCEEGNECLLTSSSSSSDSEDDYLPPAPPRDLPKSREFFSRIDMMDGDEFHTHFRMGFGEWTSCITQTPLHTIWAGVATPTQ